MTTPSVRALPSISQSLRLNSADLASLFYIHPATPFRGRGGMIVLRIRKSILPFSSRKQFQAPLVHRLHLYCMAALTDIFAIVVGE